MKIALAALKLVLADIAKFQVPTYAVAVAGVVVPIAVAVAGVNITPAEVGGWLVVAGAVAATVEKLTSGQAAKKVAIDKAATKAALAAQAPAPPQ